MLEKSLNDDGSFIITNSSKSIKHFIQLKEDLIVNIHHDELSSSLNSLLNQFFFEKKLSSLAELNIELLMELAQKKIGQIDFDEVDEDDQDLLELESIIDDIDMEEFPIIFGPIEDLRFLMVLYTLPETQGQFLTMEKIGHQICRCTGTSLSQIKNYLFENEGVTLTDIHNEFGAGVNCGTCMPDVKKIFEMSLFELNPTPIEWMVYFNKKQEEKYQYQWGEFLGLTSNEEIKVKLNKLEKSDFIKLVEESTRKKFNFIFV